MVPTASPAAVYADRLAARRAAAALLRARLDSLSAARLGVFAAGLVVAGLALGDLVSPYIVFAPVVAFAVLVAKYEGVKLRIAWGERGAEFHAAGLARLDGTHSPASDGARFADDAHPYAADLDLFGPGSLFARLSTARTRGGEDTLAAWLKAGAPPAEVASRQAAVADLTPRLDLRESLAVAGADVPPADYDSLAAWGTEAIPAPPGWKRFVIEVLGWGNFAAWFGWLFVGTTSLPVVAFGLPSLVLAVPLMGWSRRVLAPVERAERELSLLESILARLERESFASPRMKALQESLSASAQIRELRTLVGWFNARRNALFIPVAFLRMWDTRYAFKLEQWRARSGPAVGKWLTAVGEAEALSSLAGFAFENPTDVFPTVEAGAARFTATGIGHPLLPAAKCVRNDVSFGGTGLTEASPSPRLLVISGSNMSGKSTLLRSVGVNAVLALAGGVVRANSMTLTPVALGATMRVQDSLQAGRSRFFAEVAKVRALLDIATANAPPLLFLLDELFSGTNSADRVAGAEAVIRTLLDAGAIGLVTTHDLALTDVTGRLPGAINVHFCDGFAGGELSFDYTMRPGVVPHGNGLALMRAVGLKV